MQLLAWIVRARWRGFHSLPHAQNTDAKKTQIRRHEDKGNLFLMYYHGSRNGRKKFRMICWLENDRVLNNIRRNIKIGCFVCVHKLFCVYAQVFCNKLIEKISKTY